MERIDMFIKKQNKKTLVLYQWQLYFSQDQILELTKLWIGCDSVNMSIVS